MKPIASSSRRIPILFIFLIALLVAGMTACTAAASPTEAFETGDGDVDTEISPDDLPTRQPSDCPALDSQLLPLVEAEDALSMAEQLGFPVQDNAIQVLIVLAGEETAFLEEFGAQVGTQSGNEVQAYVPIDRLCDLANSDAVSAVRPVAQPMP